MGSLTAADEAAWRVRVWNEAEGLGGNNVRSILQSSDGFLWIVASGKLMRFDGVQLEHFPLRELSDRGVDRLRLATALRDGGFALAMTDGSFARISRDRFELITTGLPSGRVETMIEQADGTLLLSFDNDAIYRWHDGRLTALSERDGLPPGSGSSHRDSLPPGFSPNPAIATDEQDRMWIARDGLVGRLEASPFKTLAKLSDHRMKLASARGGGVWISSGLQLFRCDADGQLRPVGRIPAISSARVSAILEDHTGAVWVGAPPSGLFRFNGTDFQRIPISHRDVVTLTEDREKNLWVGTAGGGLNLVQPRILKIEGTETGLPFQAVQSICEDRDGTLWAVTQQGTPVRRVDGVWQEILPEGKELGEEATCIAADLTGALWMGTVNHQVFRWDRGKLTSWGPKDGISSLIIRTIFVSKSGDVWIAGGRPGTLQRFRNGQRTEIPLPITPDSLWAVTEGANGDIWAGGSRGLLFRVTSDDRVINETPSTPRELNNIRGLHATDDGTLYIAYELDGIGRFKDGTFARFTTAHGLVDGDMRQVISDGEGWLWFISLQKLFKIRQAELDRAADANSTPLQPVYYGEDHGVRLVLGRTVGALRSKDGLLWLPLATSLAIVNPKLPQVPLGIPPVFITKVTVDDAVVTSYNGTWQQTPQAGGNSEPQRLAPNHRRIDIDYTAISFSAPNHVRFRYRLDGFDREWSEAGPERKATYGRLPAGKYHFRVKASNSDGLWNETGATVALIVEPFLWDQWWFRASLLAAFAAAVFAVTRYASFRRLHTKLRSLEQAAALEQERTRIARDIHDDLGGGLTRIMMLSRLASRKDSLPEGTAGQVREISEAAQQLMKSLDETVWAVNPRNDDLPNLINYMSHYAVKFLRTAAIECVLDLPDDPPTLPVSAEVRHHVYMAMKEALNNIVRHAQAAQVRVSVTVSSETLRVSVADDGVGIAATPSGRDGNGLTNMAQRMRQAGGKFEITSAAGAGTRVSFEIALSRPR